MQTFAELHAVESTFPVKLPTKTRKMPGKLASNKSVHDPEIRVKTTRCVLDNVYVQLRERLQAEDLAMM